MYRFILPLLTIVLGVVPVGGQETTAAYTEPAAIEDLVTVERVEQLRKQLEATPEVTEPARQAAGKAIGIALADLQLAAELSAKAQSFAESAASVPERLAKLKLEAETVADKEPLPEANASLAELEQALAKLELQHTTQKKAASLAEAEPQVRAQRRKDIRARMVAVQEALTTLGVSVTPASAEEHPLLLNARGVQLAAQRQALQNELPALENELAKYDADDAAGLLRLRSDAAVHALSGTEKTLDKLKARIKVARDAAAEESVRKARLEAIVAQPALKPYAERNHELAEITRTVSHELSQVEQDLKAAKEAFESLSKQFRLTRAKVDKVGLTSSVGALLRKQRTALPDTRQRQSDVLARRSLMDEIQYQEYEYKDERKDLGDIDGMTQSIVDEAAPDDIGQATFLESAAKEMLTRRRDYLDKLIKTTESYTNALWELDMTDQQVINLSTEYNAFIDERVLWIRSGKVLTQGFGLDDSDWWLASPEKWTAVASGVIADVRQRPIGYAAVIGVFVYLLIQGARLRRYLGTLGAEASKASCRSIRPTFNAVIATILISTIWPAALALLAWRLGRLDGEFAGALGQGVFCVATLLAPLEAFRQLCRPNGLGEAHFGWAAGATQAVRRRVRWFTFVGLPFAFLTTVFFAFDSTHGHDSIERVCFIAGIAVLSIFVFRMASPTGLLRQHIAYHPGGWSDRLKAVWPWMAISTPVCLGGLAFAGFYYTAQVLAWRLFATVCFVTALIVMRALLLRMLMLRRRALSIDQARERASAAAAAAAAGAADPAATTVAALVATTPQADLSAHSEQTRRLVSTGMFAFSVVGMWLIWVQVLPALSMLDRYPLWSNASGPSVAQATPSMMGSGMPAATSSAEVEVSNAAAGMDHITTASDLALAILIAFITFVVARNGPGLLEMSVLQKLPFDASVRYAITSLVSYAIVLIGVIVSCSTIGLEWSQVQWLATALTFGLAFGLQEMFANFVAGLIILLERPIRVGDIVTVDDVTGVVSRIRIRATSITNWDRKEYIVPNKEFITGRLLNWTLTDKVNRIVINVGVAYGSDTERVREILLGVANEHPKIVSEPKSQATFEGFGDNSLNFVLRTYLATLDDRLDTIHQLHTEINKAFRAAKIEIAFPQRDLHIRSTPEALGLSLDDQTMPTHQDREAA